jgi:hypothetical protein
LANGVAFAAVIDKPERVSELLLAGSPGANPTGCESGLSSDDCGGDRD